jgi:carboxymethylenebutenolidase
MFRHGGKPTIGGILARPSDQRPCPPVLVIAGNRISEEYIANACATLAQAGFAGLAPDIFHTLPENARTAAEINSALSEHSVYDVLEDIESGADFLRQLPGAQGDGIGVMGFCYGGRVAMLFGARSRAVDAVVAFYPGEVTRAEISRLKSATQIHCGTADRDVPISRIKDLEKTLLAQSTPVEVRLYEGAEHGFMANTRPQYRPADAKVAWERTINFLRSHLS